MISLQEKYPLLTIENVKYWYYETNPPWSGIDIANHVGCPADTVYNFMEINNLPRRMISDANHKRFICPQKYQKFMKQRTSRDFKKQQSTLSLNAWSDNRKSKKMLQGIKNAVHFRLSVYQKLVLVLLLQKGPLFLTNLIKLTGLDKKTLDHRLRHLTKRDLLSRVKKVNANTENTNKLHYKYSITEQGIHTLPDQLKDPSYNYRMLIQQIRSYNHKNSDIPRTLTPHLGKNQKFLLKVLNNINSAFLVEIRALLSIDKKAIDNSLRLLCNRGFLSRKKEENQQYLNRIQYKYYITEKGRNQLLI